MNDKHLIRIFLPEVFVMLAKMLCCRTSHFQVDAIIWSDSWCSPIIVCVTRLKKGVWDEVIEVYNTAGI